MLFLRTVLGCAVQACFLLALCGVAMPAVAADADGFETIFTGNDGLKGWHVSAQSGHSNASGKKSGGKWVVEDGAISGSQDIPGNGGIILTDREYGDFEVRLEMKNDFGPDSGLFLRSTEDGRCYQAMIDYHADGNLMGVYGEGLGGNPHLRNFSFLDTVDKIRAQDAPVALPFNPEEWQAFWNPSEWNEMGARIVGNPPTVTTFIRGKKFMEYTDTQKRLPDTGRIGLQVHGGGDFTKQFVRYRNIRVKVLGPDAGK
ncbi:MAG: glycosyl hydrolase [Planctomycetaceae bacterium]|nr:MAG: glycosyl hydrolase [Planctomycetaceae bacterium]